MSNVMIEKFVTLYGDPKTEDPKDFLAEYSAALKGFDKPTLKLAAQNIARTRMVRGWPTIAECLEAAKKAEGVAKHSGSGLVPIENWDHWYGGIMRDIKYAETEREIDAAIEKVRPYAMAKWCFPRRLDEVTEQGDAARKALAAKRGTA